MFRINLTTASNPGAVLCKTLQWKANNFNSGKEFIAEEVPVALVYNYLPYAVMLATPNNLEDFATGFSLSEGIVLGKNEIKSIRVVKLPRGIQVNITIVHHRFHPLQERRRNLAGRTGCGLCGVESIEQAIRPIAPLDPHHSFSNLSPNVIALACAKLSSNQQIHGITGGVHAAGWSDLNGQLQLLREDVGRHNALDKLIGAMSESEQEVTSGFIVITSRASSEIIQKSAAVGVNLLAAVSAPTDMAIKMATESGITLIGFSRENRFTIYSNGHRISQPSVTASVA